MESLFLLVLCLLIGVALQRSQLLPVNAAASLNLFVLFVPLPALAFYYIPEIEMGRHLLFPLGVAWISIAVSWLVFGSLGRWLGWSRKLTGCLVGGGPVVGELGGGEPPVGRVSLPGAWCLPVGWAIQVSWGFR